MSLKKITNSFTSAVCLLSMALLPFQASASTPVYYDNGCCEEIPCDPCGGYSRGYSGGTLSSGNVWWLLGAAALGAAAGAGTAAAVSSKGKTGPRGPAGVGRRGARGATGATGPTGPSAFTRPAAGTTLSATFNVLASVTLIGTPPIIYLIRPDGSVASQLTLPSAVLTLGETFTLTDSAPIFGTYDIGIQFPAGTLVGAAISLAVAVEQHNPTVLPDTVVPLSGTGVILISGDNVQYNYPFAYEASLISL